MEQLVRFSGEGLAIFGNFSLPGVGVPCVVMSHGLESSKDGNKWRLFAHRFHNAGLASLRFSYRGCGEGPEKSEGVFENTTLSGRIEDFRSAIDFVEGTGIDASRLGVIGSSFGGMAALAAQDSRIKAMVILATPCRPLVTISEPVAKGKRGDFLHLPSGRKLRREVLRDMRQHDICQAAERIGCPLLILHGSDDEIVPVGNAYDLYEHASEPKRLEIIQGGNHSLDGPGQLEDVVDLTLDWFSQYL